MTPNTLILEGGLGNRMRVAAAALATARRTGYPIHTLWLSQWGMPCRFDQLFLPSPLFEREGSGVSLFTLRDARSWERLVYARSRAANLHLPRLVQHLLHRRIITSPQIYYLQRDGFDFDQWFARGGGLMMAYRDFAAYTSDDLRLLFRPQPAVQLLVEALTARFTAHTIGCHIRRTDHQQSISESPLELFTEAMDRELAQHVDTRFFLATDDEATKAELLSRYGHERVLTADFPATRQSADGIRHALAEMLALAATSCVYGSAGSTFSQIACQLGDIPLQILRKE
ncbi:MAG: hypothetical protein J5545_03210 [Bacteroidaceae bacterium]|nr:hypothetical protein [Bacteroidaceae bacterium]